MWKGTRKQSVFWKRIMFRGLKNLRTIFSKQLDSPMFFLEVGLGYGRSIRAGSTITVEGTAAKYTVTIDHNGVKSSFSPAGYDATAELLKRFEFGVSGEVDTSGEFTHTVAISQRERTIGRAGNDIELSIGFSKYTKVGGGVRIVFNVSEYKRQRGR
jgi:hypothetical protein